MQSRGRNPRKSHRRETSVRVTTGAGYSFEKLMNCRCVAPFVGERRYIVVNGFVSAAMTIVLPRLEPDPWARRADRRDGRDAPGARA